MGEFESSPQTYPIEDLQHQMRSPIDAISTLEEPVQSEMDPHGSGFPSILPLVRAGDDAAIATLLQLSISNDYYLTQCCELLLTTGHSFETAAELWTSVKSQTADLFSDPFTRRSDPKSILMQLCVSCNKYSSSGRTDSIECYFPILDIESPPGWRFDVVLERSKQAEGSFRVNLPGLRAGFGRSSVVKLTSSRENIAGSFQLQGKCKYTYEDYENAVGSIWRLYSCEAIFAGVREVPRNDKRYIPIRFKQSKVPCVIFGTVAAQKARDIISLSNGSSSFFEVDSIGKAIGDSFMTTTAIKSSCLSKLDITVTIPKGLAEASGYGDGSTPVVYRIVLGS